MTKCGTIAMLAIATVLVAPAGAHGQGLTTGEISGRVVDGAGRPVAEALITLTSSDGAPRSTQTTLAGTFALAALSPGDVTILVEKVAYRPTRVTGVPVRPGVARSVVVTLEPSGPSGGSPRTVRYGAGAAWVSPGFSEWQSGDALRAYAGEQRWAGNRTAELSPSLAGGSVVEGLPLRLASVFVDGVPLELQPEGDASAALPFGPLGVSSAAGTQVLLDAGDVEWGGLAAAGLSLLTRHGGDRTRGSALATWSGGGMVSPDLGGAPHPAGDELQGGASVAGALIADTSFYSIAVDARRLSAPYVGWPGGSALAALAQAAGPLGVDLAPYGTAHVQTSESVSGSGTVDWQLSGSNRLSLLGLAGVLPEVGAWRAGAVRPAIRDALVAASLASGRAGATWRNDVRLWYENARLSWSAVGGAASDSTLPFTEVSGAGPGFGVLAAGNRSLSTQAIGGRETLTADAGAHRIKLGLEAVAVSFRRDAPAATSRAFVFGSAADLGAGQGLLEVTGSGSSQLSFSIPRYALFIQDTWRPDPGLQLLVGARLDQALPSASGLTPDTTWLRLSGVEAPRAPGSSWTFEPRVGFRWSPRPDGAWILRGGVGVYAGREDPRLLGEALGSGDVTVTRYLGTVGPWPTGATGAGDTRTTLETVASAFRPPATTRATAALTHTVGPVELDLGVIYRETRYLPTWSDLNALDVQVAVDQNQRPLYASLAKEGGLVTAEAGGNRRFPGFGPVYALESTATSRYLGGQIALRARLGAGEVFASYTRSHTSDNWVGAASGRPAAELIPLAGVAGTTWADGMSDFDVPNLAVLGGRIGGNVGRLHVTVSGAYHYRSGLPFTPGFGAGIDANGDGSALNDPAFIDPNVPGLQALIDRFPCLKQDAGHLARRNGCRDPGVGGFDVELAAGLRSSGRASAEIVLEATGLAATGLGLYDHALVTVNPSAPLGTGTPGTVTVPVVANPDFGSLRVRLAPPQLFRIGLRIRY